MAVRRLVSLNKSTPQLISPQTSAGDTVDCPVTLNAATGNEIAYDLQFTTNKATSGNDTGLLINQTDTASPGTSLLLDLQVGGTSKFSVANDGNTGINTNTPGSLLEVVGGNNTNIAYTPASNYNGFGGFRLNNAAGGERAALLINPYSGEIKIGATAGGGYYLTLYAGGVEGIRLTENTGVLQTHQTNAGLTADSGSVQGGTPLTSSYNEISTSATTGDSVTLPTAAAGQLVTIINNGANAADVFPASGDNLGAGADTASSLAAGSNITYFAINSTDWEAI